MLLRLLSGLRPPVCRLFCDLAFGTRYDIENEINYRVDPDGPAGAFAQEVTVLPLNVSKSEDEIRHGMIIGTRTFNENPNIRLFQLYLWLKYPCISSKNSWSQNERFLPHLQPNGPFW
jgi:hypothetical protein